MASVRWLRFAIALPALWIASAASAQGLDALKGTTPKERATAQTAMMKERLALTDAQLPQVAALNQTYAEKMEPLIQGSGGPLVRMREAQQIEAQKEAELQKLLTPDQFQKFLAGKDEMREKLVQKIMDQRAQKRS